jgi:NTP pyrophosphatase (non-canonical NTP hydrolase)|tara:strand:+ start:1703 stop:2074 length:372 start_codon:yes stop_codon:yes gene_type:complete
MNLEIEAKEFLRKKNMSNITATEYQKKAKETAIFPADKALEYLSLGLVGEAGEVANKVKKLIRDKKVLLDTTVISSEIGDVLWYCAMLADYLDVNLGKIMDDNLDKLKSRKQRGTLGGTGDNR